MDEKIYKYKTDKYWYRDRKSGKKMPYSQRLKISQTKRNKKVNKNENEIQ